MVFVAMALIVTVQFYSFKDETFCQRKKVPREEDWLVVSSPRGRHAGGLGQKDSNVKYWIKFQLTHLPTRQSMCVKGQNIVGRVQFCHNHKY